MSEQYWEDYGTGSTLISASVIVDADQIVAFAKQFDPQPFHLPGDPHEFFGGLIASGWHTASLTMRLLVESAFGRTTGAIGVEVHSLRWPQPVRPGDALRARVRVLDRRESRSRPEYGLARIEVQTLNQRDEVVQFLEVTILLPRRP